MRAVLLIALAFAAACSEGSSHSLTPLLNRCVQDFECGKDSKCDPLGICIQQKASKPYDYRVQIKPTVEADGGPFATFTTDRATLTDGGTLPPAVLARAVFLSGSVRSVGGMSIEAELVFTPRDENALGGALSVFTRPGADGQAFRAQLEPNRIYDVLAYPRGSDSFLYPPFSFELPIQSVDQTTTFTYPALVEIKGQLRDEDGKPAPRDLHIKTRWRDRLLASSSIGTLDALGNFTIYAPQAVLDAPAMHELALDLSEVITPQNVQIVFNLSKKPADGVWIMPALPQPVQFIGTVVTPDDRFNVDAQLTWISDFPLPTDDNYVGQVDWCRLKKAGMPRDTFRCSAYVTTSVTGAGGAPVVSVKLMPGEYKILVAPSGTTPIAQRLATASFEESIQSQPDGMQEGRSFQLFSATLYAGNVENINGKPMPAVTISANALGVQDGLEEVALYNRSDRQTSAADGRFRLAVDIGIYDLLASPPEGSGYASELWMNRRVDGAVNTIGFGIKPRLPIILRGTARDAFNAPIAMASVDAYALVPDLAGGPDRAVRIARTTTDSDGKYALQMPPKIGDDNDLLQDAGVAPDAGAQR